MDNRAVCRLADGKVPSLRSPVVDRRVRVEEDSIGVRNDIDRVVEND